MDFAIQVGDKGYWVLHVDAANERFLIAKDDNVLRWVPFKDCKMLRAPKWLVWGCDYLQVHDFRVNEEELVF